MLETSYLLITILLITTIFDDTSKSYFANIINDSVRHHNLVD